MFLSIIIPTWRNTEEEIRRCLDSIDQSAWRDFEVLLVDDGNEAAYATMLDGLAETYPMLRVFHLSHGGASAARNFGAEKAAGEYILFVDADDIVTKQFWHDVAEIERKGCKADVVYGMVPNPSQKSLKDAAEPKSVIEHLKEEELRELYATFFATKKPKWPRVFFTREGKVSGGSVARLLRRDLARKIPFNTNLGLGEDTIWNLDIILSKPNAVVFWHVWYRVVGNPESLTRGCRKEIIAEWVTLLRTLRGYVTADTEIYYWHRVFDVLEHIGKTYYLSPRNSLSWFQKVKEFNQMAKAEPFNVVLEPDWKMGGGVKASVKLALYKAGFLLYVYQLKKLLRR